ncbi:MAG: glycine cleavage system protein GcvH [Anaerolineae bacterium]|jgi:glycine cleavage system H protein|nr:glycine cleavage system protein GcvH [Anaerolineae bacterium]MBT4311105.1 glycine cleavage system protein GcvH [Anaerolineae bacterium]MBT4456922.1 glycine cleavage system protein GcvH [Anaerolineae bacterium]MBT4841459.1 glycine cleavage system protein GcvH [Anaerolineae bacterium]MBT6323899.1 glycine cleavage system protein GcvH [Anaerolineae bacterium]
MNIPSNLKYTKSDEWLDPATGKMGLTDYAQDQLSDIVFVEALVDADDEIAVGDGISEVESVKASAEVYASASGTVTAINEDLEDSPEVINSDPYGAGWLIQVEINEESDELMDTAAYEKYCADRD